MFKKRLFLLKVLSVESGDYLPTCLIPSEVCKSGCEPTVNLVQGQLVLRGLNHRLHDWRKAKKVSKANSLSRFSNGKTT
jgi:hypothetical protein